MKRRLAVFFLLALMLSALTVFIVKHVKAASDGWTVMVYMAGSELESEKGLAGRSIREMRSYLRDDAKLLILAGGISADGTKSDSPGVLYEAGKKELKPIKSVESEMGDSASLEVLLSEGLSRAKGRTALILWDHGYGALGGFGGDVSRENDQNRLTLVEIASALKSCGCAENKLDLIGFDACLMAGIESAELLLPYAAYMIASEETEPAEGWDYAFLGALSPTLDAEKAGRFALAAYANRYARLYSKNPEYRQPYTLSLIDLSKVKALSEAVDGMLNALSDSLSSPGLSKIRTQSEGFARIITNTEYDLMDLSVLADALSSESDDAKAVTRLLKECVLLNVGSEQGARGLSIYFPFYAEDATLEIWKTEFENLPLSEDRKRFVLGYIDALKSMQKPYQTLEYEFAGGEYLIRLKDSEAEAFDRAKYFVLTGSPDEGLNLIYAGDDYYIEDDRIKISYDGSVIKLSAGGKECVLPAFYIQSDGDTAYYRAYALYYTEHDAYEYMLGHGSELASFYLGSDEKIYEPHGAAIRIEKTPERGLEMLSAYDIDSEITTGRRENLLNSIDRISVISYSYLPEYDENGAAIPYDKWNNSIGLVEESLDLTGGCALSAGKADAGEAYYLQIVLMDVYGGEQATELIRLGLEGGQ